MYGTSYNLRSDHTPLSEMVRRQKWGGGSRQLHNVDEDYANHPNRSVLATPPPSLASPSRASSSSSSSSFSARRRRPRHRRRQPTRRKETGGGRVRLQVGPVERTVGEGGVGRAAVVSAVGKTGAWGAS